MISLFNYVYYNKFIIMCYICCMNNGKIKILQKQISINFGFEYLKNYMIIIETIDFIPQRTYLVDMHDFIYYDENMPFYVINRN